MRIKPVVATHSVWALNTLRRHVRILEILRTNPSEDDHTLALLNMLSRNPNHLWPPNNWRLQFDAHRVRRVNWLTNFVVRRRLLEFHHIKFHPLTRSKKINEAYRIFISRKPAIKLLVLRLSHLLPPLSALTALASLVSLVSLVSLASLAFLALLFGCSSSSSSSDSSPDSSPDSSTSPSSSSEVLVFA